MPELILASQSPRRRQILSWLTSQEFSIQTPEINEQALTKLARTPDEMVQKISQAKAKKIINQISNSTKCTILAADTTVILMGEQDRWLQIGKPSDQAEAQRILKLLRDKTHLVFTGIYIATVANKKTIKANSVYVKSEVTFKNFSDTKLDFYLKSGDWQDKAGGYGIQQWQDLFIKKFTGSYTNIVGLPAQKTAELLSQHSINLNSNWPQTVQNQTNYPD